MNEIMTEQDLLEARKDIPAWKASKKMHHETYKQLEEKRFNLELNQINNQHQGESYYDSL